MIYRHDTLGQDTFGSCIYNYLSNFISDITYDSSTGDVTFFDTFTYRITPNFAPSVTLLYGSQAVSLGSTPGGGDIYGNRDTYLILGEDFLYLKMMATSDGRWIVISYFKDSNGNYWAGGIYGQGGGASKEYALYAVPYYNLTEVIPSAYYFQKVLPFVASTGKIIYAEQSPLVYSDSGIIFVDNIYCCSTVPIRSTVSIGNDNYVAIDTNNIVVLDSE